MADKEKDEGGPLIHFRNPRTGVSVWPVMVKDSEGNWVDSCPDAIESLMKADSPQRKPDSGKK
jgi:hypothetical protein